MLDKIWGKKNTPGYCQPHREWWTTSHWDEQGDQSKNKMLILGRRYFASQLFCSLIFFCSNIVDSIMGIRQNIVQYLQVSNYNKNPSE